MPVGLPADDPRRHQLVRWVQVVRGSMEFRLECQPAFNYGRDPHTAHVVEDGVCFERPGLNMGLGTRETLRVDGNRVVSQFTLHEGQTATFAFGRVENRDCGIFPGGSDAKDLIDMTE